LPQSVGDFNYASNRLSDDSSVESHDARENLPQLDVCSDKKNLDARMAIGTYVQSSVGDNRGWRYSSDTRKTPQYKDKLQSDHISWVQVNHWNSVFGPMVQQVWCTKEMNKDDDVFEYIARQTLQASCTSNFKDMPSRINTEVHICPEFDVSVVSATLNVVKTGARYSLSLVISHEETDRFLTTIDAVQDEMSILGHEVQAVLESHKPPRLDGQENEFRDWKLVNSKLKQFARRFDLLFESRISRPVELESTWFFYELNEEHTKRLSMVITSHLQMRGRTVIVGPDSKLINLYVYTLCLFSDEGQRALSRDAVSANPENVVREYCRQFYIQGIFTTKYNDNAMRKLQDAFLLAPGPTSFVNLFSPENGSEQKARSALSRQGSSPRSASSKGKGKAAPCPDCPGFITQTPQSKLNRYKILEKKAEKTRDRAKHGLRRTKTNSSSLPEVRSDQRRRRKTNWHKKMEQDSPHIREIVNDALSLPTPLVLTYISAQYRILQHKAAELLAYIEEENGELLAWNDKTAQCTHKDFPSGDGIPRTAKYPDLLKQFRVQVMADLKISNPEDFCVFLSIAERYRPNLILTLYGNPIVQQRMQKVLELFL